MPQRRYRSFDVISRRWNVIWFCPLTAAHVQKKFNYLQNQWIYVLFIVSFDLLNHHNKCCFKILCIQSRTHTKVYLSAPICAWVAARVVKQIFDEKLLTVVCGLACIRQRIPELWLYISILCLSLSLPMANLSGHNSSKPHTAPNKYKQPTTGKDKHGERELPQ